ncbi:MAG: hypothetical protein KAU02_02115 [Tenericutes bacterium]|nr:hypothetical protein [Mycoplasmatota bacterium]
MNRNHIKFIAAFAMALDHIAVILFSPENFDFGVPLGYTILRIIGRIAFVLFAYMLVEGFFKTSNLKNYFFRLLIFAGVVEIFIIIIGIVSKDYSYIMKINVIWPLVFGLGSLMLLRSEKIYFRLLVIPIVFLAEFINISYGAYGVLLIMIFALYRNPITQVLFLLGMNLLFIDFPLYQLVDLSGFARYQGFMAIQWFSMLGFIFIFLYNGKKGKVNTKWFFYIFYPVHLGIIYGIYYLIS